jgi:chromosomal replication initiator protein
MSDSTDYPPFPRGCTSEDLLRWERVRQRLRAELGDAIYDSWFTGLELERVDGDGVQLTVPTKFLKSWVQTHYLDRIRARVAT